jgi:hypothetical protein
VNIALRTLTGPAAWTPTLAFHAGFSQEELRGVVVDMQEMLSAAPASSLQAVRKKYSNPRFGEVATIPIAPLP